MTTVAETILSQLGGRRFIAMSGANNLVSGERSLSMSLPGNLTVNKVNRMTITQAGDDTYVVEVARYRSLNYKVVETVSGVMVESLEATVTMLTGLRLRL